MGNAAFTSSLRRGSKSSSSRVACRLRLCRGSSRNSVDGFSSSTEISARISMSGIALSSAKTCPSSPMRCATFSSGISPTRMRARRPFVSSTHGHGAGCCTLRSLSAHGEGGSARRHVERTGTAGIALRRGRREVGPRYRREDLHSGARRRRPCERRGSAPSRKPQHARVARTACA